MPTPPCQPPGAQPPGAQPPGAQPPGARPDSRPGSRRRGCPRVPGPPLPDPDGVRLWPVPDSAPPYDDELLQRPARPADPGRPAETASRRVAARAGRARAGQREQPGGQDQAGGQAQARDGHGEEDQPGQEHRPDDDAPPRPGGPLRPADGAWPGQFAQVLVETLAGSRPPRQISSWATERARARIQRLGPMLAAGHRPQLRRVVAFRPASDVIEMTVVVSFGPRVRALAIRLEHCPPPRALPGRQPGRARWLCTEVEAA